MMRPMKPAAALLLIAALALTACGRPGGKTGNKAAPVQTPAQAAASARTVSVVKVESRVLEGGIVASGVLAPREDTAVFSEVSGYRVARVLADEGEWVRAGQPLVILDDTLIRSQIDQQSALAAQQQIQAERAQAEADRVSGLDGEGVLSQEQLDARRFAARAARAQAAAQAASLRDLRTRQAKMTLRAPYAGLVIERNVRPGDMAAAGANPWFRIAQGGQIELVADVAEGVLSSLTPGMTARVTLANGQVVIGTIRLISPRVDVNTKLGKVRILLPVSPDIRAGGFARATFEGGGRPTLVVPETAVRYDANGAAVMVVGSDNRVRRMAVRTGAHGAGFVELVSGPPQGARVVLRAAAMLVEGDIVRPQDAPAAAPVRAPERAPGR